MERGYGQSGRNLGQHGLWAAREIGKVQKQASVVDPSENGRGRVRGGGCHRSLNEIERVFDDFKREGAAREKWREDIYWVWSLSMY